MWCFLVRSSFIRRGLCFFFQAEDGIRDIGVTGVQTCALPIYPVPFGGNFLEARAPQLDGVEADVDDELHPVVGLYPEGVPALEELDQRPGGRGYSLAATGWHYGPSLPRHPLREDLVGHLAQGDRRARDRGQDLHKPSPLSMRSMRAAMRSDWVPMTTWATLPRLTTPEAPSSLSLVSSMRSGSATKSLRRVMHPSTLSTFSRPPRAASTFSASTSSRSRSAVAVAPAGAVSRSPSRSASRSASRAASRSSSSPGLGPRWLSGRIQSADKIGRAHV